MNRNCRKEGEGRAGQNLDQLVSGTQDICGCKRGGGPSSCTTNAMLLSRIDQNILGDGRYVGVGASMTAWAVGRRCREESVQLSSVDG